MDYNDYKDIWKGEKPNLIRQFLSKEVSFIPNLLPEDAIALSPVETIDILRKHLGDAVYFQAISVQNTYMPYAELPEILKSPVRTEANTDWLKKTNMVGINVRTVQSFWNVVKT